MAGKTNYDLVKEMTMEQMLEFLTNIVDSGSYYFEDYNCKHCNERINGECIHEGKCSQLECNDVLIWLNSKVEV